MPLDTQQIEILGRNLLVSALLREGIEVALPLRDNGIDLLAYTGYFDESGVARMTPIQLKCASTTAWGLKKKYARIRDLHLVYVWHVAAGSDPEFHCMRYEDAEQVLVERNYAREYWQEHGSYAVNGVGGDLRESLAKFKVKPGEWRKRLKVDC